MKQHELSRLNFQRNIKILDPSKNQVFQANVVQRIPSSFNNPRIKRRDYSFTHVFLGNLHQSLLFLNGWTMKNFRFLSHKYERNQRNELHKGNANFHGEISEESLGGLGGRDEKVEGLRCCIWCLRKYKKREEDDPDSAEQGDWGRNNVATR